MSKIDPLTQQLQVRLGQLNQLMDDQLASANPMSAEDMQEVTELMRQIQYATWAQNLLVSTRHDVIQSVIRGIN
ncbi:hypothetical protein [Chitinivorax sp. B]|uniref:hypothetical protein n=1 Tax=Chitinivorax sp. B TaxID=2502235 RepID=UPI0014858267|nr:hypothetical protein [Chitinivorax sp. B]